MIELLVLIFLCKNNHDRALERGRSGGSAIAYTIAFWLGFEFLGAVTAVFIFGITGMSYIFGLIFAVVGAIISYLISKKGKIVNPLVPAYQELSSPCTVLVYRDNSSIDSHLKYSVYLNGQLHDGCLDNDSFLEAQTTRNNNSLAVSIGDEDFMRDTYEFGASPNGLVKIHILEGKFQSHLTSTTPTRNEQVAT